jgi:proline iminopeptidase
MEMDSKTQLPASYLDYTGRDDVLTGGVKMIPIQTPKGTFHVWTKRIGNHPTMKVLLLHGGPGVTHEYLEAFDSFFPAAGIEYYYYDQLGSYYSDQPNDPELLEIDCFVEEVEQVRKALRLDRENFYLYGQSWGGLLAMEYALKYQQQLKGIIISNMMSSIPRYNEYAHQVLMPAMDQEVLAEIQCIEAAGDFANPRYMELLVPHHYVHHVLRMPADKWPEPMNRSFKHVNSEVYVPMQGTSELGASGKLVDWDRSHRQAHADDWRMLRHYGSGSHGMDGERRAARTLSLLPEWQPYGLIRRPAELLPRADPIHSRCRCGEISLIVITTQAGRETKGGQ